MTWGSIMRPNIGANLGGFADVGMAADDVRNFLEGQGCSAQRQVPVIGVGEAPALSPGLRRSYCSMIGTCVMTTIWRIVGSALSRFSSTRKGFATNSANSGSAQSQSILWSSVK